MPSLLIALLEKSCCCEDESVVPSHKDLVVSSKDCLIEVLSPENESSKPLVDLSVTDALSTDADIAIVSVTTSIVDKSGELLRIGLERVFVGQVERVIL